MKSLEPIFHLHSVTRIELGKRIEIIETYYSNYRETETEFSLCHLLGKDHGINEVAVKRKSIFTKFFLEAIFCMRQGFTAFYLEFVASESILNI